MHETAMPTDVVQVRPLRREDRADWLRLWVDYHAYGRSGGAAPPDAVTAATWERFCDEHEPMAALVAELEGRLVGLAHMVFHRSTSVAGPVCFLQGLFVAATLHGRGIGRALIAAVYARAEAAGARRVYWHVLETNAPALRLYDKAASRSGHVVYRKDL
jgi:GNAT superfamily N-acetyltransferase